MSKELVTDQKRKSKQPKPVAKGLEKEHSGQPGIGISALKRLQQQVGNRAVQRLITQFKAEEGFELDDATAGRINRARGGGQRLDGAVQAQMSEALGYDFSGVRMHTDAEADELNQGLQAKAFTTGPDIFFKRGEYDPASGSGRELIAHELTHVAQQSTGRVSARSSGMTVRPSGDASEQEAEALGIRAAYGGQDRGQTSEGLSQQRTARQNQQGRMRSYGRREQQHGVDPSGGARSGQVRAAVGSVDQEASSVTRQAAKVGNEVGANAQGGHPSGADAVVQRDINEWKFTDEQKKHAVHVSMDDTEWTTGEGKEILWTEGLAFCLGLAAHSENKWALAHLSAIGDGESPEQFKGRGMEVARNIQEVTGASVVKVRGEGGLTESRQLALIKHMQAQNWIEIMEAGDGLAVGPTGVFIKKPQKKKLTWEELKKRGKKG